MRENHRTTAGIHLCSPQRQDGEHFFDLYRRSLRSYFESTLGWDETFRRAAFRVSYPLAHCHRICLGDEQVFAGMLCLLPGADASIEVALLLIEPAFQNIGIGQSILTQVCMDARHANQSVRLATFKLNLGAARLYLRLGFEIVSEDDHYLHFRKLCSVADPTGA
jgi:ribosomal protein S18 acetylase RimI-like enzyme